MSKVTLEVFTDFVCPWCYLATPRIEKLRKNHNVEVQWNYFPLHPDTPANGLSLKELFAGRNFDLEAAHARLKTMMDAEGLVFNERGYTYNSRLAQELATGFGSDELRSALYKAYFQDGRNIGDIEVLVDVAGACGLAQDAVRAALTGRTFKDAVDAMWLKARQYGITGVPSFVVGNHMLVGAQPYEMLERLIASTSTPS